MLGVVGVDGVLVEGPAGGVRSCGTTRGGSRSVMKSCGLSSYGSCTGNKTKPSSVNDYSLCAFFACPQADSMNEASSDCRNFSPCASQVEQTELLDVCLE